MSTINSKYLYYFLESTRANISPMRYNVIAFQEWYESKYNPFHHTELGKTMRANLEIIERMTRKYLKPEYKIDSVMVQNVKYNVHEVLIDKKPFCNLIHFKKDGIKIKQPKLLIVAPMAGHHATLLRDTIKEMLILNDVYVTDWIDASQVPLSEGKFDMHDFIEYNIDFLQKCDKGPIHVMAICQPTVCILAASAIMSEEKNSHIPKSMILVGGPVDARKSPTPLEVVAEDFSLKWFKNFTITEVPHNYPGHGRKVYPGFLQLMGFVGMNWKKHYDSHIDMYKNLLVEDDEKAEKQKDFYDEFLSTMDLPAEFFLQTVKEVFQKFSLAKGKYMYNGKKVDLSKITKSALMGVEGENDDIAAVGQTVAALDLCTGISKSKKEYLLQEGVGHYGVFSGSKFRQYIAPKISEFIKKHD
jgi:poly(3-hydroxybutyrate) depolymerase